MDKPRRVVYDGKPKTGERPTDKLVNKHAVTGTLDRQRKAYESGDPAGGKPVVGDNDADSVLDRGYYKHDFNEKD